MSTVVSLHGGPRDGTTVTVAPPWPRTQIRFEDGTSYYVTEGTTDAEWSDPATDAFDPDPGGAALAGAPGAPGIQGPPGLDGATGPEGPAGPARIHRGPWDSGGSYAPYDEVEYLGSSYTVKVGGAPAIGVAPTLDGANWFLTSAGSTGGGGGSLLDVWQGDWDGSAAYTAGDVVHHLGSSWLALVDVDAPAGPALSTFRGKTAIGQLADGVAMSATIDTSDTPPSGSTYKGKLWQFEVDAAGTVTIAQDATYEDYGLLLTTLYAPDGSTVFFQNDAHSFPKTGLALPAAGLYLLLVEMAPAEAPDTVAFTVTSGTANVVSGAMNPAPAEGATWSYVAEKGDDGAAGAAGADGAAGAAGPAGLTWLGAWNAATAYAVNDAVSYLGSSYRRTIAGTTATGPDLDTVNWAYVAQGATIASTPIEPWHEVGALGEPALTGSWVYYGSNYPTPAFKKYPDGRVRLKGLVKNGINGQPIFTLPVGYRPPDPGAGAQLIFPTVALSAFGEIRVGPDGAVVCQAGANGFVSLDGIEFDTGSTAWPSGPKGDTGPPGLSGGSMEDFAEVKVVADVNVNIANPGTRNWDSDTVGDGQRVLLNAQTTPSQNGIYVLNGTGVPMTRASDADVSAEFLYGRRVRVTGGLAFKRSIWSYSGPSLPTIGTTALTFQPDVLLWAKAVNFSGPWLTGALGPTQGVQYTVPADGDYLFVCTASAYATAANQNLSITVYVDGNGIISMNGFTNEALSHKTMVPLQFVYNLTKGLHFVAYSIGQGTSNNGDFGSISLTRVQ